MIRTCTSVLAVLAIASTLQADVLRLRDGSSVRGRYMGGNEQVIRFQTEDGRVERFPLDNVRNLFFGSDNSPNANNAPGDTYDNGRRDTPRDTYQNAPSANNRGDRNYQDAPGTRNTPGARYDGVRGDNFTVPSGTRITVRMIEPVDSDRSSAGQTFRASLDEPVVVNGQTLIPSGADAMVRVVDIRQGGRIRGSEEVSLQLSEIRVGGRSYPVNTDYAEAASSARGSQSAKVIGGTAVVGAIIGGIAGGGSGAAIGAASGAAAGTGIQAVRGQRVRIESEARLDFTLAQPLTVR